LYRPRKPVINNNGTLSKTCAATCYSFAEMTEISDARALIASPSSAAAGAGSIVTDRRQKFP
jgi:hypothetical protein